MASSPQDHPAKRSTVPDSILVIGAGVFGLSTIVALLANPRCDRTTVTLVDDYLPSLRDPSNPTQLLQNPHAASIDSSRIIRPDYAEPAYARLASLAQHRWRNGFGQSRDGASVYRESGIALTADDSGSEYVNRARENAKNMGYDVQALESSEDIEGLLNTGGRGGVSGYVNWGSGWADNGKAMESIMGLAVEKARKRGKVVFRQGHVEKLAFETSLQYDKVVGVKLADGEEIRADLTIVSAGAWSGALVNLTGRAEARGQVVAYVLITEEEQERLKDKPVLLNLSTGMFFIPPVWDAVRGEWILKIARHGYGYANPTTVSPEGNAITTSLPNVKFSPIPVEGEVACRAFLKQTIPWLGDRPFSATRICWYTDTPSGDFLISYHPSYSGLFLATGGSGHGFKFLPVLGEKIVAAIEYNLEEELASLWRWRQTAVRPFDGTNDGSRGGKKGMVLEEEWRRGEVVVKSNL